MGFKHPQKKGKSKQGAINWAVDTTVKNIANRKRSWGSPLKWFEKEYSLTKEDRSVILKQIKGRTPDKYEKKIIQTLIISSKSLKDLPDELL